MKCETKIVGVYKVESGTGISFQCIFLIKLKKLHLTFQTYLSDLFAMFIIENVFLMLLFFEQLTQFLIRIESGTGNRELVPGSRFDSFNGNNFLFSTLIELKLLFIDNTESF